MDVKIAPSLLAADFTKLREQIAVVEQAGADVLHLDVMDGHFVPNITFGPLIVEAVRRLTDLPLDVHLMIQNPDVYVDAFVEAGADWISFHIETEPHAHRLMQKIKDAEKKAGIVLNPSTPLQTVDYLLDEVDYVLLMTVNPGFGGQHFIPASLQKIQALRERLMQREKVIPIEVDGGINRENISDVAAAGAEIIVAGSSIFGQSDPANALLDLRRESRKDRFV